MPSNFLYLDSAFPKVSEDDSERTLINKVLNYQYLLTEQLRYTLGNLGEENFNETEWNNITTPIYARIKDSDDAIAELSLTASEFLVRLEDNEENVASLTLNTTGLALRLDNFSDSGTTIEATIAGISTSVGNAINKTTSNQTDTSFELLIKSSTGTNRAKFDNTGLTIFNSGFRVNNGTTNVFYVDEYGDVVATNLQLTGGNLISTNISSATITGSSITSASGNQIVTIDSGEIAFKYGNVVFGTIFANYDYSQIQLMSTNGYVLKLGTYNADASIDSYSGCCLYLGTSYNQTIMIGKGSSGMPVYIYGSAVYFNGVQKWQEES